MMSKTQFCRMIINKYKVGANLPVETPDADLVKEIHKSSGLAVALQHLGIIKPGTEEYEYASTRGGFLHLMHPDPDDPNCIGMKPGTISVREMIQLLPD